MIIQSESNLQLDGLEIDDVIQITARIKSFSKSQEGIVSLEITDIESEITQKADNRQERKLENAYNRARASMDTSMSSRQPIPVP